MPFTPDATGWVAKVQRAEAMGFYSVSVPDHLGPSLPQLAPMIALASASSITTTIRLAIKVLNNDFRNPSLLAKEIATLDVLSAGRVDMGIGADWLEEDLTKTGIATWDPPGTRVSRLFESISVLRRLFTGEPVTFAGQFYSLDDFTSVPKPIQDPLPIMLGGGGKRMLTYAAKHAQIVSI
ncbi:MAG: LLM class flavin-dependent oxidoreductase [Actinomycetota bacterium]|nr:LLM class flavin-dependent oxidoreductase [Actinomycetota bacterium]